MEKRPYLSPIFWSKNPLFFFFFFWPPLLLALDARDGDLSLILFLAITKAPSLKTHKNRKKGQNPCFRPFLPFFHHRPPYYYCWSALIVDLLAIDLHGPLTIALSFFLFLFLLPSLFSILFISFLSLSKADWRSYFEALTPFARIHIDPRVEALNNLDARVVGRPITSTLIMDYFRIWLLLIFFELFKSCWILTNWVYPVQTNPTLQYIFFWPLVKLY